MRRALTVGFGVGVAVGALVGGAVAGLSWLLRVYDEAEWRGGAD